MAEILVIEDDEAIQMGLVQNLKFAGHHVKSAGDGPSGLKLAVESKPDLVLLDLMLPGMTGYEVCRELRAKGYRSPVIMLTARKDEFDKLHGFEVGADDYVTKPFSVKELLARVNAVLARGDRREDAVRKYQFGDCTVDLDTRTIARKGKEVSTTRTEFDLMVYFCANEGKALSRDQLMNDIWGMEYYGTQRSIDTFVAGLRAKVERDPKKPVHIITLHGVGYKFVKGS